MISSIKYQISSQSCFKINRGQTSCLLFFVQENTSTAIKNIVENE